MKKFIGKIHLWLGLVSGSLVFIIAITGAIYAFQDEIRNVSEPFRFIEKTEGKNLPPSELMAIAQKELPSKTIHAVMYPGENRAAKVIFYSDDPDYYHFVYIHPVTGKVLGTTDELNNFFAFILDGHFYLWLPPEIGKPTVATATLVFFFMVVTGIILWWPKNKNNKRQKFTIRWNARWRRKNYDLHSVLGFYASWIALIFIVTGLVWGFQWFYDAYYFTVSGGKEMKEYANPVSTGNPNPEKSIPAIDRIYHLMQYEYGNFHAIEIHPPEDTVSCIAANANPDITTYWQIDYRYFDQYSLEEKQVDHMWGRFENSSTSDLILKMNYDIHVGAIWGITGKTLACLFSLLIASLPITGFLLWYGRKRKNGISAREFI